MTRPTTTKKFALIALGSYGDVHPFIGLAIALQKRGHDVVLMTNPRFEPIIRREHIAFIAVGTLEQYEKSIRNPDLWNPRKAARAIFEIVLSGLEEVYNPVVTYASSNPGVTVVASSLALAARCGQDKLGFRMATVHLAPAVFRSSVDPPKIPALSFPSWLPLWARRAVWAIGDRFFMDPLITPRLNAFRAAHGLPPVKRVLDQWWNSPDRVIGLFPSWFANNPGDWWPQTRVTGFPLYDERDMERISPDLETFLNAGLRPIAVTFGSAMRFGKQFFEAAVETCERLGVRGVLLTREPDQIPAKLPPHIRHVRYAPFSDLLPRCGAIVHHGGIGTTAQALRAGIPQLIVTLAHDQFDNAERVRRLGAGASLLPREFTPPALSEKLTALMESTGVRDACSEVARRFEGNDGLDETCRLLEQL